MKTPFNSNNLKKVYNSALSGAYFGIVNILALFIPFLTSLSGNSLLSGFYAAIMFITLVSYCLVILFYKDEYSYSLIKLKYLIFVGVYTLVFYVGFVLLILKSFTHGGFSNTYLMGLFIVLGGMSSFDILICANKGFSNMKRLYTRTFKKQIILSIIIILLAVLTGLLFLAPYKYL